MLFFLEFHLRMLYAPNLVFLGLSYDHGNKYNAYVIW